MNSAEIQGDFFETKEEEEENRKHDAILYVDNTKDNDLIQFISQSHQQGFNCLDLSKRTIKEFPSQLLEFTTLQYLYLEGNKLTQLPSDLFLRLPHLKWLDLRRNQLTSIPSDNLAKHRSLQYLLLSGNCLRTLPFELGKVKTLSALNLDGNPLDQPPFAIIKQGIKSIQQYLRDQLDSDSSISSDEEEKTPRFLLRHPLIFPRKSKSEMDYYETIQSNILPSHLQSCIQYKRINYSATRPSTSSRSRPQSEMRFSQVKTKKTNEDADTVQEQPLMHLQHRDIKPDQDMQPSRQRSFMTLPNYEEPLVHTPFHIDPRYLQMTNKDQQNLITYNNRQKHSTNEEERRMHDRQIQDRIRRITETMLKRRLLARSSIFEEKRQVKLELREIRRLEFDTGKQHRPFSHIDHRFKSQKKF